MAAPILYISTRQGVYDAFGGQKFVAQTISDGNGDVDLVKLDTARKFAAGDVAAACGNSFKIWEKQPDNFPQFVVMLSDVLCVYWVWWIGTQGKGVPDPVKEEYDKTLARLEKIAKAQVGLGADPDPSGRLGSDNIDISDGGRRAVYPVWDRAGLLGAR